MGSSQKVPPVLLLSHGTTLLTGEQSHVRDYWKLQVDEALEYGIKGVIMMGAHWSIPDRKVHVAMNPNPKPQPIALVRKPEYVSYRPNADIKTSSRCIYMLKDAGFDAVPDPNFNWLIDTFPILLRMFPNGCPPVTIISQNAYFEPHFHLEIGRVLRPLRKEGYLFIGSGGGVHNLYRADWKYNWRYRDNFAQENPPDDTHLEFRQALEDVLCKNGGGPALKRGVVRLMKHPNYRDAHGTDDHYMPTCFVAGLVGEEEDRKDKAVLGAEVRELEAKAHGLKVTSSILGELHSRPTIVQSVAEAVSASHSRPFDFLLVSTKATAQTTSATVELIAPAIASGTKAIVLIQNGLGVERPFYAAFPETTIISGVAYLPTTPLSPAVFAHSETELLHLGVYPATESRCPGSLAQLGYFVRLLRAGGATAVITDDVQGERWRKIVANAVINPICALSRCRDRELIEVSRPAACLLKDVMVEVAAVANSAGYGHVVTEEVVEKQFSRILARPYPGIQPSMMDDALESRSMEVQAILGEVFRIAQESDVEIPRLTTLYVLLEGLDKALAVEKSRTLTGEGK